MGSCYEFIQVGQGDIGRIAQECQPYVTNAIANDPCLPDKAWAQRVGAVAFAGYPLIVENRLVGIMALFARRPFAAATLRTLSWVAGVMAMGIDRLYIADALARSIVKVVRNNKTLIGKLRLCPDDSINVDVPCSTDNQSVTQIPSLCPIVISSSRIPIGISVGE